MVLCDCGCGGEIVIKRHHKYYGIPKYIPGHQTKKKGSPNKGKHLSEETKQLIGEARLGNHYPKISESKKGCIPWNKGTKGLQKASEETKLKMSKTRRGKSTKKKGRKYPHLQGENSAFWKGGLKLNYARHSSKRRELGNNILNNFNMGLVGHHINFYYIVYIPKEINKFCYHNVRTGKNMEIINYLSLIWLIISGEINNCKEV